MPPRDFVQALRVANAQPETLKKAFRRLDKDGCGRLSRSDLRLLMADVKGSECSEEEADQAVRVLLREYDHGGAGALSYSEFEAVVHDVSSHVDPRAYALAATIGVAFMSFSVMFPMGPTLIRTFGMSQLQFGTLTTAFALAKLCGNIPAAILSENFGRKPLLVGGLVGIGFGLGGVGLATCYQQLMMLRLCTGLGVSSTFTAANMYVTDISHPLNSARTRAPMQMGMSAGMLIGPACGGFMLEHVGLQLTAFGVGAATWAIAAAALALLPETNANRRGSRTLAGLSETLKSWAPILRSAEFRRIVSWGWCYNAAFWGAMSMLPLIYVDLSLAPTVVGLISTMNAMVSLASTPMVASVADRFGKMSVVVPGAFVYGVSLILIPQASCLSELLPVLAVSQVGAAMCSQAQIHAMDCAPAKDRAKVPSLWNTVGDTGMLASSLGSAALAQMLTTGTAFRADGALLLAATAMLLGAIARR